MQNVLTQGVAVILDTEALLIAGINVLTVLICTGGALYLWLWPEASVERYVSRLRSRKPGLNADELQLERIKKRKQLHWMLLLLLVSALVWGISAFLNLMMALGI